MIFLHIQNGGFPFLWIYFPHIGIKAALKQDYDVNKTFRVNFRTVSAENCALREKKVMTVKKLEAFWDFISS